MLKPKQLQAINASIPWNIFLITAGVTLFSIGVKGIAIPHGFISTSIFGTGMLIYYATGLLDPSLWYFVLNVPLFALGWIYLSKRFFWYSVYGFLAMTLMSEAINCNLGIKDPMIASIATGLICGAGIGLVLRSLGSDGGLTIIAIILNQKFNLRIGQVTVGYNLLLFLSGISIMDVDRIMYSLISVFITSNVMDSFVSMFNNRKMALIISDHYQHIAAEIMQHLGRGVTLIRGSGAFTHKERMVILTVVHNYQIKRMEDAVFSIDPNAFVIIENTFNVLGTGFSKLKIY